jgi:hypothetical protein
MFSFKGRGVAIVFVSHNLQAVADLCDRVLFLKRSPQFMGSAAEGISAYVKSISAGAAKGDHAVTIRATLLDDRDTAVDVIAPGRRLRLRVAYESRVDVGDFLFAFIVRRTTDQLLVYDGQFTCRELGIDGLRAGRSVVIEYDFTAHLTRGQYHIQCHVFDLASQRFLGWLSPAGLLTIDERRTWGGVVDLGVRPRVLEGADSPVC